MLIYQLIEKKNLKRLEYTTSVKMNIIQPQCAIYAYPFYGPTFGVGHDL